MRKITKQSTSWMCFRIYTGNGSEYKDIPTPLISSFTVLLTERNLLKMKLLKIIKR